MQPPHRCGKCRALVTGQCQQCEQARKERIDSRRGSAWARGYDLAWKRLRDWFIRRRPLCVMCEREGRVVAAHDVDHIIPFNGINDPLRLDSSNLQGLCVAHHSAKTATENSTFANATPKLGRQTAGAGTSVRVHNCRHRGPGVG